MILSWLLADTEVDFGLGDLEDSVVAVVDSCSQGLIEGTHLVEVGLFKDHWIRISSRTLVHETDIL